jgi:hypothetical protein
LKISKAQKYSLGGIGLVLLATVALLIFSASGEKKTGPVADPTVCEYCGNKLNKSGECPKCIAEMGLKPYQAKRESKNWYNSPVVAYTIISLLALLVVIHLGLTLWKWFQRKRESTLNLTLRCFKCGRKLRYRSSQIGHMGKCPLCLTPMRFPEPIDMPRPTLWARVRSINWKKIREIVWD